MQRYSVITEKDPREIVLLRGHGCQWGKCTFCDYYKDSSGDDAANYELNREVLSHVDGRYGKLEVINSGSCTELDGYTINEIVMVCMNTGITEVIFEAHWMYKDEIDNIRQLFAALGIVTKFKIGVETFDYNMRENILHKGIEQKNPLQIAPFFDQVNLLQGLKGQTAKSMIYDIDKGLECFERVCVNIMNNNSTDINADPEVVEIFRSEVMPRYIDNDRVDILINNTDFGVGE